MGSACSFTFLWPRKMGRYQLRNFSKTSNPPRRPFEKERLDAELKLIGQYGLKNKLEIWRVRLALAKLRATARTLLTKDEKDPQRIFEGQALMRRMIRYGILDEDKQRLDYVLSRLQAWSREVHPPRPCADPSTSHPCGPPGRQCAIFHGACRAAASHRVLPEVAIRWWQSWPCQAQEPGSQGWWR